MLPNYLDQVYIWWLAKINQKQKVKQALVMPTSQFYQMLPLYRNPSFHVH